MNGAYSHLPGAATEPIETVSLNKDGVRLTGKLAVPAGACGLVVLAQDEPGGSLGPRVTYLASLVRLAGFGTLVCDLRADPSAERACDPVGNPGRLSARLATWLEIVRHRPALSSLPLGLSGTGVAGAAVLLTAARLPARVSAAVAVAGRLDLIPDALPTIQCPTLLVIGEHDRPVMRHNRHALRRLRCHRRLEEVPGAHHRFQETNALMQVAVSIRRWMRRYLIPPADTVVPRALPALRIVPVDAGLELVATTVKE